MTLNLSWSLKPRLSTSPTRQRPPRQRDATTLAVLRYFETRRTADVREHADAFDHLVGICHKAVKPFFLRDRHGSVTVKDTPQFNSIDGRRTGYDVRTEGAKIDATRQWIQDWLLRFLSRYQQKSEQEIVAAADAGKFRHLGLWCRLRIKQILYRQYKRENKQPLAGFITATEAIGTTELGAVSSLQTHPPSEGWMAAADDAPRVVMANADELEKLDLLIGLQAYLAEAEHVMEPQLRGPCHQVHRTHSQWIGL